MRLARRVAEAAIAEATSVHSQIESRVALLAAQAEATTLHAVREMAGEVQVVVVQVEDSTSRVIGAVAQLLESKIEMVATCTIVTSARNTQVVVDGLRTQVEAQMNQNCVDLERKQAEIEAIFRK